jgi:hypothetical protein
VLCCDYARYIATSQAWCHGEFPALETLDRDLEAIGTALSPALAARLKLQLSHRSDPLYACFPAGASRYGAHFDGGGDERCKLTMIAYANEGWRDEDGGALEMLDEAAVSEDVEWAATAMAAAAVSGAPGDASDSGSDEGADGGEGHCGPPRGPRGCWRAVAPRAGRVVFFLTSVLHRVAPTHARRFALTAWWFVGQTNRPGQITLVRSRDAESLRPASLRRPNEAFVGAPFDDDDD